MGEAFYNWGRWVVSCPACNGAEERASSLREARKQKGRGYFRGQARCGECGYEQEVAEPTDEQRREIERLLKVRPTQHRNWKPGETTQQLRAENTEHLPELVDPERAFRSDVLLRGA